MRVAVIVVGLVVVSTPSQASRSCMTQRVSNLRLHIFIGTDLIAGMR
jgi:hypothetical protein